MTEPAQIPPAGAARRPLDELDRSIIALLQADCQTTNRALARELGVTEATVASRVSALVADRYIRFALQRNLYTWGYRTLFFGQLTIRGRPVEDVCADLREIPEVVVISAIAWNPQVVILGRARSDREVAELTRMRLRTIAGVQRVEVSLALETLKIATGMADLTDE